jgi:hypothetical protein
MSGVGFFELKGIPHVIKENFDRFIKRLYQQQIAVLWIYRQSPQEINPNYGSPPEVQGGISEDSWGSVENDAKSQSELWTVRIYCGTRETIVALFNVKSKRIELYQKLKRDLLNISSAFQNAYPHSTFEPIHGSDLANTYLMLLSGGSNPLNFQEG